MSTATELLEWLERQTLCGDVEWTGSSWIVTSTAMSDAQHEAMARRLRLVNSAGIRPLLLIDTLRHIRARAQRR